MDCLNGKFDLGKNVFQKYNFLMKANTVTYDLLYDWRLKDGIGDVNNEC